jgi:hypothetical protein
MYAVRSYQSQVNQDLHYDESTWLVSLQNVGGVLGGHARIVVEGVENGNSFVGQYEIAHYLGVSEGVKAQFQKAIENEPGVITGISVFERENYVHPAYSNYHSKSWFVTPENIRRMVQEVKKTQGLIMAELEAFQRTGDLKFFTHAYQKAGSARTPVLGGNGGDNCVTWAEKMLAIANAGNGVKPVDSFKAAPEAHVRIQIGWTPIILTALGFVGLAIAQSKK